MAYLYQDFFAKYDLFVVPPHSPKKDYTKQGFVPPDKPYFYQYLDPPVLPLVQAFLDLGYLTVSSCGGHDPHAPIFVTLAFDEQDQPRFVSTCQALDRLRREQNLPFTLRVDPQLLTFPQYDDGQRKFVAVQVTVHDQDWETVNKLIDQLPHYLPEVN